MSYEFRCFENGEELTVLEIDMIDSGDPDCLAFTVYVAQAE